jgi:hypothetical protein
MSGCAGKMTMSKGGPKVAKIKKMAAGGVSGKMIPLYDNNPRVYSGRTLKNGGSASLPVCRGGDVRRADGSCGKRETTFKKGGNVKLAKLAPPTNKVTRADVIAGALKNKRKKGK